MELISTTFLGKPLMLEASLSGWQRLFWNGYVVSEKVASTESEGEIIHRFQLQTDADPLECELQLQLQWQPFQLEYRMLVNNQPVEQGGANEESLHQKTPDMIIPEKKSYSVIGLFSLALKLLKSAKAIKVAMAGASIAAYSWLVSLPFALTLIACLVFHEYGHLRAMKYFGMKTKGIYLIPFLGGLALGDDKINTRWQDVVISIMGPVFGLLLSLFFLVLYWLTDEVFFAGVASFNALINLFNLLPILPLDGGHILKSISFSMHSKVGLVICIVTAALGVLLSYHFGLGLLAFMLCIGVLDIVLEWKTRHESRLFPLNRYAQIVSGIWYVAVVSGFVGIVMYLANTDHPVLGLPKTLLQG